MTTEHAQMAEPLPVEDEAAAIALLATDESRPDGWTDEAHDREIEASREHARERSDALWAGDTRRAVYGMAAAAQRIHAALAADASYLKMIGDEIERRNEPKRAQAAWLEEQVIEHGTELLPTGPRAGKFVDLTGVCRIQYVDRARTVRIADAEAFIAWAKAHEAPDLYETREHLSTNAAKEEAMSVLETSGELLPGVVSVPAHRTGSIKWDGA